MSPDSFLSLGFILHLIPHRILVSWQNSLSTWSSPQIQTIVSWQHRHYSPICSRGKKKPWVMLDCFTSFTSNVLWNFHLSMLHLTSSPPCFSSFLSSFKAQLKSSFSVVLFPTLQSIWPSCLHLQASLLLLLLSADLILLSVEVCREKGIRTGREGWDVKAYWCWARVSLDKTLRRSQVPRPVLTVQWPPGSEDRLMINKWSWD